MFAICFGMGNGMATISRAGLEAINGVMNAPVSAARARVEARSRAAP
ncbi:MAG: hypothetical protein IIA68_06850 [Proteobacteria bacterium]|nr:hypothetical protein [Pseudomonadota bacterium]